MTLAPALARLERGFRRMWGWCWARVNGARAYRYEGEQEAHAEQLRETEVSLSLMATADAANPDQVRMASDIEHGAENRLAVLLGRPRLSLAEKRERDAIQAALAARRQEFGPEPQLVRREQQWRPQGFLAATALVGGVRLWMIFGGLAALMGLGAGVQTWRLNHAKADLAEARSVAEQNAHAAAAWRERADEYRQGLVDAANVARQAADALEGERARQARAAARERRRQREIQDILAGGADAPDWRLRDTEPPAGSGPGGN